MFKRGWALEHQERIGMPRLGGPFELVDRTRAEIPWKKGEVTNSSPHAVHRQQSIYIVYTVFRDS